MDILQSLDFIKLVNECKDLMKGQLSKKCFVIEKEWMDNFERFSEILLAMQDEIRQLQVS